MTWRRCRGKRQVDGRLRIGGRVLDLNAPICVDPEGARHGRGIGERRWGAVNMARVGWREVGEDVLHQRPQISLSVQSANNQGAICQRRVTRGGRPS